MLSVISEVNKTDLFLGQRVEDFFSEQQTYEEKGPLSEDNMLQSTLFLIFAKSTETLVKDLEAAGLSHIAKIIGGMLYCTIHYLISNR